MASFHDRVRADGLPTGIFLRTFGVMVTRYPLAYATSPPNYTQPEPVLAVVAEDDAPPSIRNESHEGIPRTRILEVTAMQAVDKLDAWSLPNWGPVHATLKWRTDRIEGRDEGMQAVHVERADDLRTSRTGRG